ncbi:hypothetical protein ACKKBF_B14930 [Auxenochlorella protothecoides x Auxenochlorella symbiontica]|uniref:Uncharacterized protein n=1 Tax=Auxenochlorella protothecoides TaxID=3075 RepID=A0A1D1ZXI7_AUXPR
MSADSDSRGGGLTSYFKTFFGSTVPAASSAGPTTSSGVPSGTLASEVPGAMPRLKVPQHHDDARPEIVMSPSDIGLYEISHDGKFNWRKMFQSPTQYNPDQATPPPK